MVLYFLVAGYLQEIVLVMMEVWLAEEQLVACCCAVPLPGSVKRVAEYKNLK